MATSIYRRKLYDKMLSWKKENDGRTALLIKGARRIGKSTIAEEFAQREYESYILLDFSNISKEIMNLFDDIFDLDYFFLRLQSLTNKSLVRRKSVIVFDEVQLCPKARQAIKHLVKDRRYDYIETGSLLSIKKNVKDIVIPSEETRLSMYPMDFEEFLWAVNKVQMFDLIKYAYEIKKPVGEAVNRALMREFRLYMLVGGMPQAINAYIEFNDFQKVDSVKRNIIELYEEDFRKIDSSGRAATIFRSLPGELTRNSSRFKVGGVIENARPSRMGEIFADIVDSMVMNMAYHANDPNVGFSLHANYDAFKMYLGDTGLFVTMVFMDKDFAENELYRKLLSDKVHADLGYLYENVVAQLLVSSGHNLYYYTFRKIDEAEKEKTYEIDFLLSSKDKINPVEVKSSGYRAHRSLDEFYTKYSRRIGERYLIYTKDLSRDKDLLYLPVYMTGLL